MANIVEKKGSYAGKISHSGSQFVEGAFQSKKQSKAKTVKGGDLRAGKTAGKQSKGER